MNENVTTFLDRYIDDPDPRYAVLLDGEWGCGKSFFIKEWIKRQKTDDDNILVPIYVSLFGLSKISQINEAINMEIYPFLKSKYYRTAKTILSVVGKAVLKYDADFNGNGNKDATIDIQIDPIATLLKGEDEIEGKRFLVLDDLERTNIDYKSLLGYINSFVERHNFKVVLVCNSKEISKEQQDVFERFKEKVIGRSFLLTPDVDAALNVFLDEAPQDANTINRRELIKEVFKAIGYKNLRVLRQAIRDYNNILLHLNVELPEEHREEGLSELLVRYIVILSELSSGKGDIINYFEHPTSILKSSDKSDGNTFTSFKQKYEILNTKYGFNVLDSRHNSMIIDNINNGAPLDQYLYWIIKDKEIPNWKRLESFMTLSNEDFDNLYATVQRQFDEEKDIMPNTKIGIIYLMYFIEDLGIREVQNIFHDSAVAYIREIVDSAETISNIKNIKDIIIQEARYFYDENIPMSQGRKYFQDIVNNIIEDGTKRVLQSTITLLENLSFDSISELINRLDESVPGENINYRHYPIFNSVDVGKVADSILSTDNRTRKYFYDYLDNRYEFTKGRKLTQETIADEEGLCYIKNLLIEGSKDKTLIDKLTINMIIRAINAIVGVQSQNSHQFEGQ